jgi:hypothetical protein
LDGDGTAATGGVGFLSPLPTAPMTITVNTSNPAISDQTDCDDDDSTALAHGNLSR